MGSKPKKNEDIKIPDPTIELIKLMGQHSRFELGKAGLQLHEVYNMNTRFAFDYICMDGTSDFAFNHRNLSLKDLNGFIDGLKKISKETYKTLKETPAFRFHPINFDDKRVTIKRDDLRNLLTTRASQLPDDQLPTLYQVDIQYTQAARICGFLYGGLFYILWYDRFHKIYPQKK